MTKREIPGWLKIFYNPTGKEEDSDGSAKTIVANGDQKTSATQEATNVVAVNPTFERRIKDAMAGAKKMGFEEFMAVFSSLHEDIADEGTCFRSAIKTVGKTEKLTSAHIITAVEERLGIIEADKKCFETDLDTEASGRINEKTNEVTDLESQIATKKNDLSNLQKEIETLTQKKTASANEVDLITEKKNKRLAEYNLVFESHKTGLKELKEKLELYSKGGK